MIWYNVVGKKLHQHVTPNGNSHWYDKYLEARALQCFLLCISTLNGPISVGHTIIYA